MHEYKKLEVSSIKENDIDILYKQLLNNKYQFIILSFSNKKYVLTKERSLIEIKDENEFLNNVKKDIYYKTIIIKSNINVNDEDLNIYKFYLNKYKDKMSQKQYGDKYYFGCIAVKTDTGFITTIRGKENFDEYTIVENVNHNNHSVEVINKKASLNAPLLDYLFNNKNVKSIVHLHDFDEKLPYYEYAFPGTVKDSIRNFETSFNIKYHGVIYLFDKKGEML